MEGREEGEAMGAMTHGAEGGTGDRDRSHGPRMVLGKEPLSSILLEQPAQGTQRTEGI